MNEVPDHFRGIPVPAYLLMAWDAPSGIWWRQGVEAALDRLPFHVEPDQIYADGDYRKPGRTLRVERLTPDGMYAICTVLTNYDYVQWHLDYLEDSSAYKDMRGTETAIKVRRLYPNARGYRLISSPGDRT